MKSVSKRQVCEKWTRVMGYHRPVSQYNYGKKSEFYSREYFSCQIEENRNFNTRYGENISS